MIKAFKIKNTTFQIENDEVMINNTAVDSNLQTLHTLVMFLESDNEIISKNAILQKIWKDIIVSDASIFKQVHLVKQLFIQAQLPADTIENIYGKGYKIKYKIEKNPIIIDENESKNQQNAEPTQEKEPVTNKIEQNIRPKKFISTKMSLAAIILICVALFSSWYFNQKTITTNKLNPEKKAEIIALMKTNWQKGYAHLSKKLADNQKTYSNADMAFIYANLGLSAYHLHKLDKSLIYEKKALALYENLDEKVEQAKVHLNLSNSFRLLNNVEGHEQRKNHILKAIELLKQSNKPLQMIDAHVELAYLQRDQHNYQEAILSFVEIQKEARAAGDLIGEMIALNSQATTYGILGQIDKAIATGERGLKFTLENGKGRHIASAYSFLSDLYAHQGNITKAVNYIQQALKFQLANNDFSNIIPKIANLDFLLIQSFQYQIAERLLEISQLYIKSIGQEHGTIIFQLYAGMNFARQNQWQKAKITLTKAIETAQKNNLNVKKPLSQAYLSLVLFFNKDNFRAIELAKIVLENEKNNKQSKAIAALALAYTYDSIEKSELANKWLVKTQELMNHKWLFEYLLFLKLKLSLINSSDKQELQGMENQIKEVNAKILSVANSNPVDKKILNNLINKLTSQIQ